MKKSLLFIIVVASIEVLNISCVNDASYYDVLDIGPSSNSSWRDYMDAKINLHESDLDKIGIYIQKTEPIKGGLLYSDIVSNESLIPVYHQDSNTISLLKFSSLCSDTSTFHLKVDYLKCYIDSILDKYNSGLSYARRNIWKSNNSGLSFSTISFFDLISNELEYDNVLFNLFEVKEELNTPKKSRLSRSELFTPGYKKIKFENKTFRVNGIDVSMAGLEWAVYGEKRKVVENGDTVIRYFHSHFEKNYIQETYPHGQNLSGTIQFVQRLEDVSQAHESIAQITVWSGIEGNEPSYVTGTIYPETPIDISDSNGAGYFVERHYSQN